MEQNNIENLIAEKSTEFDPTKKNTVIMLAAGHGKRIKSNKSKMLHEIWGKPTCVRVCDSALEGFEGDCNLITVVGVKAESVINAFPQSNNIFAHQAVQNGTGHAVQIALEKISDDSYDGNVYVLLGDMGLFDSETMYDFRKAFEHSKDDMMVLTGIYEGNPNENTYGRIIRVPEKDLEGNKSGSARGNVIEIMEYKDIQKLPSDAIYKTMYDGKSYGFKKNELIENNEFNSGVFAYRYKYLKKLIYSIKNDNVQGEIYLTDLISLFNEKGLNVGAVSPQKQHSIMGFNTKSVLTTMNSIARNIVYEKIKDIVIITDPNDFFIDDKVVNDFLERDKSGELLEIEIGKGTSICCGVKLGANVTLGKEVLLKGNIVIGDNCSIGNFCQVEGNVRFNDGHKLDSFTKIINNDTEEVFKE